MVRVGTTPRGNFRITLPLNSSSVNLFRRLAFVHQRGVGTNTHGTYAITNSENGNVRPCPTNVYLNNIVRRHLTPRRSLRHRQQGPATCLHRRRLVRSRFTAIVH